MRRRVRAFFRSRSPGSATPGVYQATTLESALILWQTPFTEGGPATERLSASSQATDPRGRERSTMKAARFSRFGGPEVLEIVDLPEPHPKPGEVRIAVRAAGVNLSDCRKRQGEMD